MSTQQRRSCANCASFGPEAIGASPMCWNAVSLIEHQGAPNERHRDPGPDDVCHDHATAEEVGIAEIRRHLETLPKGCLHALQVHGELMKSLGVAHPATQAAWQEAEALDPSGYLGKLVRSEQDRLRDAQILADASPEFIEAMHLAGHLKDTLGIEHPETCRALTQAMELAPQSFKRNVHDMAVEMGLMPATPDGYAGDGQPVYTLEGVAARMGITVEQAQKAVAEMVADSTARGLTTELLSSDAVINPITRDIPMTEEINPLEIAACCGAQLRHALCEGEQTVATAFSAHILAAILRDVAQAGFTQTQVLETLLLQRPLSMRILDMLRAAIEQAGTAVVVEGIRKAILELDGRLGK